MRAQALRERECCVGTVALDLGSDMAVLELAKPVPGPVEERTELLGCLRHDVEDSVFC